MAEDKRVNNTGQGLQNVNVSENRRPHQIISEFLELLRANIRLVVAVIAVSIFLFLLSEVLQGELMRLDRIAISLFVMRLRTPWLTPIMEAFSALATPVVLLVLLLVVIAFAPGLSAWLVLHNQFGSGCFAQSDPKIYCSASTARRFSACCSEWL